MCSMLAFVGYNDEAHLINKYFFLDTETKQEKIEKLVTRDCK